MKRALVVGIDHYKNIPLAGCVNDAVQVAGLLEANGDGSPNFAVKLITSEEGEVTSRVLHDALDELFASDAETAVFYFAGHGLINTETNAGYIVSQNGERGAWGCSLSELLNRANHAYPRIKSSVIILDSCHSGYAGEVSGMGDEGRISAIGNGVTILTACHRQGQAGEIHGHGIFTDILVDGLRGGSADICGRITPASIYSHVDQTLGPWEQRPIYKANVQTFVVLREVPPKVRKDTLRMLPKYFPDPSSVFKLDPSFEPDRGEETEKLREVPVIDSNVQIYRELQNCNRFGLVVPIEQPHMWHAAVYSTGCRLTALGAHYRKLAELRRIL